MADGLEKRNAMLAMKRSDISDMRQRFLNRNFIHHICCRITIGRNVKYSYSNEVTGSVYLHRPVPKKEVPVRPFFMPDLLMSGGGGLKKNSR